MASLDFTAAVDKDDEKVLGGWKSLSGWRASEMEHGREQEVRERTVRFACAVSDRMGRSGQIHLNTSLGSGQSGSILAGHPRNVLCILFVPTAGISIRRKMGIRHAQREEDGVGSQANSNQSRIAAAATSLGWQGLTRSPPGYGRKEKKLSQQNSQGVEGTDGKGG